MSIFSKKTPVLLSALVLVVVSTNVGLAENNTPADQAKPVAGAECPLPKPGPEHQWLQQFVGNWTAETQAYFDPSQPPVVSKGTETIRPIGGFWTVSEVTSTMMDMPFAGNMTLGYDADNKQYVGTWVDSMTGHMWTYHGNVDATGKTLTLESEGACPMRPGKLTRFKEVIELQGPDHKQFTSSMLGDDGKWVTVMTSRAQRQK